MKLQAVYLPHWIQFLARHISTQVQLVKLRLSYVSKNMAGFELVREARVEKVQNCGWLCLDAGKAFCSQHRAWAEFQAGRYALDRHLNRAFLPGANGE